MKTGRRVVVVAGIAAVGSMDVASDYGNQGTLVLVAASVTQAGGLDGRLV